MALLVGALLALATGLFASGVGLDRDRGFYPTVAIVVATYNILFAVMAGIVHVLVLECLIAAVFVVTAMLGFRSSLWLVVGALAGHGILDLFHRYLVANPGVPEWWPPFCMAFDVVAAAYLAWLLKSGRRRAI